MKYSDIVSYLKKTIRKLYHRFWFFRKIKIKKRYILSSSKR